MKHLSLMLIALAAIATTGVLLVGKASAWQPLDAERVAGHMVGAPGPDPNKCCNKAILTSCITIITSNCVSNPNCPNNFEVDDTCTGAACVPVTDPNSKCGTPALGVTSQQSTCVLNGLTGQCVGGFRCNWVQKNKNITYINCNALQSLCTPQPAGICP